jgi:hypothetical protein
VCCAKFWTPSFAFVLLRSIKSNWFYHLLEIGDGEVSHKNLAIGTIVVLASIIGFLTFMATTSMLQALNPLAAVTAFTVALIGIVWFKKVSH